ncbi:hypothetical protein NLJ89_g11523 [Agrocybe chaxingu]|uniref:Uncharacterized protein n=1 Tax=Agrocybe chaxingu TaxID=84603 RepID=A0A9W8JNK1_9AGAR|nr:hypothetical protein NLJ89_g11523 [Agrocybe chaxingu]
MTSATPSRVRRMASLISRDRSTEGAGAGQAGVAVPFAYHRDDSLDGRVRFTAWHYPHAPHRLLDPLNRLLDLLMGFSAVED